MEDTQQTVSRVHQMLQRAGVSRQKQDIRRFMRATMTVDDLGRSDRVSMIAGQMIRTQRGRQLRSDVAERRRRLSQLCTSIFGSVFIAKMADASTENNGYIQLYVGLCPNPSATVDVSEIIQRAANDEPINGEDDLYFLDHYFGLVLYAYLDTKSLPRDFFAVNMFFVHSELPRQESGSSIFEKIDLLAWAFPFEAGMIDNDQHAFVIRNAEDGRHTSARSDIFGLLTHPSEQKYYQRRWKQSMPLSSKSFWSAFGTTGGQVIVPPKSRQQRQSLRSLLDTISMQDILNLFSVMLHNLHAIPEGTEKQYYLRTNLDHLRKITMKAAQSVSLRTFLLSVNDALRNDAVPYSTKKELSDMTEALRILLLADLPSDIRIPDNLREAIRLFRSYVNDTDTVGKLYTGGAAA